MEQHTAHSTKEAIRKIQISVCCVLWSSLAFFDSSIFIFTSKNICKCEELETSPGEWAEADPPLPRSNVVSVHPKAVINVKPPAPEAEIRGKPWKTGPAHLLPKTFFIFPFNTWECEEWNSTQYTPLKKAIRKVQFSVSKCEELGPRWNEAAGESEELGTRRLESQPRPALLFAPKTTAANFEQYTVHSTKEGGPKI